MVLAPRGDVVRAIVFDLDGTLIDSLPDIAAAVNHVLALRGLEMLPEDQVSGMIGDGAHVLLNRAFSARGVVVAAEDFTDFMAYYTPHSADKTRPYPGIEAALADLQNAGHRLGVCTNKPAAAAREILAGRPWGERGGDDRRPP
jgi:phosphoglycolate phosphatase